MSERSPVNLGTGLPETVLPPPPDGAADRLARALSEPVERRRDAVSDVASMFPRWPDAWAALADLGRDDLEAYAYYRVGYHRGLDGLRGAGWRGSGYVRAQHPTNRGFLECLEGLRRMAEAIGEVDEAERCRTFLAQLDPSWSSRGH